MPSRIVILPEDVAIKIAAGEVVERPASVIKELVENSIDAGADRIEISVDGGGVESITVRDNGSGIDPDDLKILFKRHATSKIATVEDITNISTFGFRGEALTSIAQVSRLELLSKIHGNTSGIRIYTEGGSIKSFEDAGCPEGTAIIVSDLFFNVPARKKFLRSRFTENSMMTSVVERFGLAHPEIYFKLMLDSKTVIDLQSVRNLRERVAMIFGAEILKKLVELSGSSDDIKVAGFVSPPEIADIRGSYLYVNKRFVRDRLLQRAIMKAYSETGGRKEPYFAIISITLPPEDVDVNVHPQKYEVRFKKTDKIFNAVLKAVISSFRKVIPETVLSDEAPAHTAYNRIQESLESYLLKEGFLKYNELKETAVKRQVTEPGSIFYSPDLEVLLGELVPKCQIMNKYLLCESDSGLVIIDQHAAHEMLTFYKLKASYREGTAQAQYLLESAVVELSSSSQQVLLNHKEFLLKLGIDIEEFGNNAVILRSLPVMFNETMPSEVLSRLASDLQEIETIDDDRQLNKMLSSMACYSSIRAGKSLTPEEMQYLINDLRCTVASPYCPHGRPVLKLITYNELNEWFRRK